MPPFPMYIHGIVLNSHGQLSLYSDLFSGITWVMDWTTTKLLRTQESSDKRKINV